MSYFRLAWRNIWRNKRRTLITAASIFSALFFALMMRSMQIGLYSSMKRNAVESFSGAIQIHKKGYWDDKQIDNSFELETSLLETLNKQTGLKKHSTRIQTGLLAAATTKSKVSIVIGAQLDVERQNMKLDSKLVSGKFPASNSHSVLVSEGLAKYLKLWTGDTIVFMGVGYHGQTAQGLYPISGILKFPVPALNNQICFMNMHSAQILFGLENKANALVINIDKLDNASIIANELRAKIDTSKLEVMDWKVLDAVLYQQIESDQASGLMMLYLLYFIVGFGIIGTVIMMTAERRREFGVMIAVGMHKSKLMLILAIEMFFLAIISIFTTVIASFPILYYMRENPIAIEGDMAKSFEQFGVEPIIPFALEPSFYITQSSIIFVIVMLCALLPVYIVGRLRVCDALYR